MPSAGFEQAKTAIRRLQIYALDSTTTETTNNEVYKCINYFDIRQSDKISLVTESAIKKPASNINIQGTVRILSDLSDRSS